MTAVPKPWTHWLLKLQCLLMLLLLFGVFATRFEILPFPVAFGSFGLALLASAIAGFVAVLVWLYIQFRSGQRFKQASQYHAGLSAGIGFAPLLAVMFAVGPANLSAPPIHDITTDTDNPPDFTAARQARTAGQNTLDYPGAGVASVQRRAYPDLGPLLTHLSYVDAYKRSLAVVEELGWRLLAENLGTGIIEATAETAVFGFKDDVIIRVSVGEMGTRVDMRSVSRLGVGDLGANAARIERFQAVFRRGSES